MYSTRVCLRGLFVASNVGISLHRCVIRKGYLILVVDRYSPNIGWVPSGGLRYSYGQSAPEPPEPPTTAISTKMDGQLPIAYQLQSNEMFRTRNTSSKCPMDTDIAKVIREPLRK